MPTKQLSANDSNLTPAPTGELPLTIWNRCGILITQTVNGKPVVKNPLNIDQSVSLAYRYQGFEGNTNSATPMNSRLCVRRHGNIGLIFRSRRHMNHSHPTNASQEIPEITIKLMTSAESHADWKFPSWRAAMMNEHAVKTRNAPKTSTW